MMTDKFYLFTNSEDAVIDIEFEGKKHLFSHPTHLLKDFIKKIKRALNYDINEDERKALLSEGLDCRILELGSSTWKSGKIRLCLQFIPTEEVIEENSIEFPLDDIRQSLNEAN